MKNVVVGFHEGGAHDRKGKVSLHAFMYGKPFSHVAFGTSIFEKKSSYRDDGFVSRLKTPIKAFRSFSGQQAGIWPITVNYDTHFVSPYMVRLRLINSRSGQ